ncbi:cobalt-precorrin-5B (C(1))-methyltransferase [Agarilytica rhodophyticola]|uniref:cobalt-precorrin-5B (C(1))-methyltransferase n=1 Tax=Agarilytica rhodophyticola TaxID=1737490 RepID=UPI000B347789|nr:cobalt-precorrin-5B (C(1))-methyltransferase [Agarilytica rhodophyticola]
MWKESDEHARPLKTGLTTGACATACVVACVEKIFTNKNARIVSVTLPKGKVVELTIIECQQLSDHVRAATIKDAGDDPDVTHGAKVFAQVYLSKQTGVEFKAAQGVGTVTRKGLSVAVGEPAINPVPRQMICQHLADYAQRYGYVGGFKVSVGIENGERIAPKTMNPRLGIVGGLSILGTTGIVRPFSCAAWVASIHQGIDVALANGITHIAASTGNTSEAAIRQHYHLPDIALIEMGDFAGAVLKHLKKAPIDKLSICGGFGKITKLANGHLDLNSRASAIDFKHMASVAKRLGANQSLQHNIIQANTSMEVLELCSSIDLANAICDQALRKTQSIVPESVAVEIWAINRRGEFVGHASEITS